MHLVVAQADPEQEMAVAPSCRTDTLLVVPLARGRRSDRRSASTPGVKPFTDKQVELV